MDALGIIGIAVCIAFIVLMLLFVASLVALAILFEEDPVRAGRILEGLNGEGGGK